MNTDKYNEVINGVWTYSVIASDLITKGSCIIGWTDEAYDHRDILFTYNPRKYGYLQRGIKPGYLFVSILSISSMAFPKPESEYHKLSNDYILSKLNIDDNSCNRKICELINGVLEYLIKLEGEGINV